MIVKRAAAHPAAELAGHARRRRRLIEFKQIHLFITLFFLRHALFLNVISNDLSGYTFTDCANVSSITPKFAAPIVLS
jgi:hypothetical protein